MSLTAPSFERISAALVQQAAVLPTSILSDVTGRHCAVDGAIQALAPGMKLAGPAFTVAVRPGDNLAIHFALLLAQPGDVLVIDGQGYLQSALMGELMCTHAQAAGLAGVVIDGAVRDTEELRAGSLPVFARGSNPNGPTRHLAGQVAVPIALGGVAIAPGDLVLGDADGLIALRPERVAHAVAQGHEKVAAEARRRLDIQEGRLVYGWLQAALQQTGMLDAQTSVADAVAAYTPAPR